MSKKHLFSIAGSLFVLMLVGAFVSNVRAQSGPTQVGNSSTYTLHTVVGWAWSQNIGWISMNCQTEGAPGGCGTHQYGVNMDYESYDATTGVGQGQLSGYAWSSNVGWISFNAADTLACPNGGGAVTFSSGSIDSVTKKKVAKITAGWARVLAAPQADAVALNAGRWNGCIKFWSSGNPTYANTYVYEDTGTWGGWAWGGTADFKDGTNVVGWIDLSGVKFILGTNPLVPDVPELTLTANTSNVPFADPKVTLSWTTSVPVVGTPVDFPGNLCDAETTNATTGLPFLGSLPTGTSGFSGTGTLARPSNSRTAVYVPFDTTIYKITCRFKNPTTGATVGKTAQTTVIRNPKADVLGEVTLSGPTCIDDSGVYKDSYPKIPLTVTGVNVSSCAWWDPSPVSLLGTSAPYQGETNLYNIGGTGTTVPGIRVKCMDTNTPAQTVYSNILSDVRVMPKGKKCTEVPPTITLTGSYCPFGEGDPSTATVNYIITDATAETTCMWTSGPLAGTAVKPIDGSYTYTGLTSGTTYTFSMQCTTNDATSTISSYSITASDTCSNVQPPPKKKKKFLFFEF